MKKLIIISVFMAVVMAFAAVELCYDSKNYRNVVDELTRLCKCIEQNEQDVSVAAVREKYDAARSSWDKMSGFSMSITNHNIIRSVSEKFVSLGAYIDANVYSDALSTAKVLIKATSDLEREKYPSLGNIF